MTKFTIVDGGWNLDEDQWAELFTQRYVTKGVNKDISKVGATLARGKAPEGDYTKKQHLDTDIQDWIDRGRETQLNLGFLLHNNWADIDIDSKGSKDSDYQRLVWEALRCVGVDTRLSFGRMSRGVPSHVLVELDGAEAGNFEELSKLIPKHIKYHDVALHTEVRYSIVRKREVSTKQTIVPGSVYDGNDLVIWYHNGKPAASVEQLLGATGPRKVRFEDIIKGISFGTLAYLVREHWTEGQRHDFVQRLAGWLVRMARDAEALADTVGAMCPIKTRSDVEQFIRFCCSIFGDPEDYLRVRLVNDAFEKLGRNPDAKIPGNTAIRQLLGDDFINAARVVLYPGSDVSPVSEMAERYVLVASSGLYIDRVYFRTNVPYLLDHTIVMRSNSHKRVNLGKRSVPAFELFEESNIRIIVDAADMYPNSPAGEVIRVVNGQVVDDDYDGDDSHLVFNTWPGFPVKPAHTINEELMARCVAMLDQLLGNLTCNNPYQIDWIKRWIAHMVQEPGTKIQIHWVCVGGQGVGKSFFAERFMGALFGGLTGDADSKTLNGDFAIAQFADKLFVMIDEARLHGDARELVKRLTRKPKVAGQKKFENIREFNVFARLMFASNHFNVHIGDEDTRDRAMFYTRALDMQHLGMNEAQFRKHVEGFKTFFSEFNQLLNDREALAHYMRYFADYKQTRASIESLEHSSGTDSVIVESTMTSKLRAVIRLIEQGGIFPDKGWHSPFQVSDASLALQPIIEQFGRRSYVSVDLVIREMERHGLIQRKGVFYIPNHKWGTAIDLMRGATHATITPYREPEQDEYGDNDAVQLPPVKSRKF